MVKYEILEKDKSSVVEDLEAMRKMVEEFGIGKNYSKKYETIMGTKA
jgi:hypothetical protein